MCIRDRALQELRHDCDAVGVERQRAAGHVHGVARDRTDGLVEHVLEGLSLIHIYESLSGV